MLGLFVCINFSYAVRHRLLHEPVFVRSQNLDQAPGAVSASFARSLRELPRLDPLNSSSLPPDHGPFSMTVSCDSALQMRLQKIDVLISGANDLGEDVRSSIISQRSALFNCLARSVRDIRKMIQQSADVVHAMHHVQIVFFDAGVGCNLASSAIRTAAEGGNTLSDQVNRLFYMLCYGIEQQMQLIEILALDVPVREFGLRLHVDRVRETGIEKIDQWPAVIFRNTDFAFELSVVASSPRMPQHLVALKTWHLFSSVIDDVCSSAKLRNSITLLA